MDSLAQERDLAIFARISQIARYVSVRQELQDDLVQEAWVLCAEYAAYIRKPIADLSNTEIRLRCFEARRKLNALNQELLVDDFASFCDSAQAQNGQTGLHGPMIPTQQDVLTDMLQQEAERSGRENFEKLSWVLQTHPTLKLTPKQYELWQIFRERPFGRWRAERARALGVTRQNVAHIARVVRGKAEAAADIIKLWEGDILPFFEKYGKEWARTPLRRLLWDVLRPHADAKIHPQMYRYFGSLSETMIDHAVRLFELQEKSMVQRKMGQADQLAMGYNLLISAVHASPRDPNIRQRILQLLGRFSQDSRTPWVLYRFVRRAGHLVDAAAQGDHLGQLKEWTKTKSKEGKAFADYIIAYYEGVDTLTAHHFIANDGKADFYKVDYRPIVNRIYNNMRIPRYASDAVRMNINFLRVAHVASYYPLDGSILSSQTRNALITICQKSLHSADSFVVSRAQDMISNLRGGYGGA